MSDDGFREEPPSHTLDWDALFAALDEPDDEDEPTPEPAPEPDPFEERRIRGSKITEEVKFQERLRYLRADDRARKVFTAEKAAATVADLRSKVPGIVSAREFIATAPELEFRIDPLMMKGGRVLFSGSAKIGKSTMALALCNSLLTGRPFLDRFEVEALDGNLVYVNAEMPDSLFAEWVEVSIDSAVQDRFKVWNLLAYARFFDPRSEAGIDLLAEMLQEEEAQMIVLDPLIRFLSALGISGDSNDGVSEWLNGVDVVAEKAGVEVMVVHHYGHGAERARGASSLLGWPDHLWDYVLSADHRYLKTGGRTGFMEPSEVLRDPLTGHLFMEEEPATRSAASASAKLEDVLVAIQAALEDSLDGLSQRDLLEAVPYRDSDVRAVIRFAAEQDPPLVSITKDGRASIHRWIG